MGDILRTLTREIYDVRTNTKYYPIPHFPNYLISKENETIIDAKNLEIVDHNNYMYSLMDIHENVVKISVDRLLCNTMYGPNNFAIKSKIKGSHIGKDLKIIPTSIEIDATNDKLYLDSIEFRHIPQSPLYISSSGIVYNIKGNQFMKADIRNGYYHLTQIRNYTALTDKIHRLVYMVWNGEIPTGYTIDHLNGYKWDNFIDNLEAVSSLENSMRRSLNKYLQNDESTVDFIKSIAVDIINGISYDKISKRHNNIPVYTIKSIACKTSYSEFTKEFEFVDRRKVIDENCARAMIKRMEDGLSNIDISKEFNLDIDIVRRLRKGIMYKNLPRKYHKKGYCFMSMDTINSIKWDIKNGIGDTAIGLKYNISRKTVAGIRTKKTYNW